MNNVVPSSGNHAFKAVIREDECIGCTQCLQVCPTDAIVGAARLMHTIITDACTGCGLCVPPCPIDCIDIISVPEPSALEKESIEQRWEMRRHQRHQRLNLNERPTKDPLHTAPISLSERKKTILQALQRVKQKNECR